jgi:hypothetical protein
LFYQDIGIMSVSVMVPTEKVVSLLPSKRLNPYRITPWQSTISITTYQYHQSDIGPYNEVSISVPVTIDKETPLFVGSLRKMPRALYVYSHHLSVTTEIAREVGAEFAGYPKFVADIEFKEDHHWLSCSLRTEKQQILKLSGRKLSLKTAPRLRVSPIMLRKGYFLRSEFVISEREMGSSKNGGDGKLELGTHPIADELRNLEIGRVLGYSYCPHAQGILTPVFESFAA